MHLKGQMQNKVTNLPHLQLHSSGNVWDEDDNHSNKKEDKVLKHHNEDKLGKNYILISPNFRKYVTFKRMMTM